MKRRYRIAGAALLALALSLPQAMAQDAAEVWSIEQCIAHAVEHNISLKQIEQERENREVELNTSEHSWLPSLNGGFGQNFDFGRSPSESGVLLQRNSASSSVSLNMQMSLFDGLRTPNDIAAKRLNLKASVENLNKAKENLAIQIASFYLQVLYQKDLLKINEQQVAVSRDKLTQTEAMVEAGKLPTSQLYDMKALVARDEATMIDAKGNLRVAMLNLVQMLELEEQLEQFDIEQPAIGDVVAQYMGSLVPPADIYDHAVTFKPQILEQQYLLQSREKMLKVAQSGYYPKLGLSASYGNGYFHYYDVESPAVNLPLADQLRQNQRTTVGLSLSVPIFNRKTVINGVRQARIGIESQRLAIANSKKTLFKEIQQAYYNATTAQERYHAAVKSLEASAEAFRYAEVRYAAGKSSVFEYNEAKAKKQQSEYELSQSKYDYIFRAKILDFYNGKPMVL